ncbi:hypothetical protein QJQ45_015666 [Haematococcus lacustris]|nr:hypothetical protein QJQ45_015666 [Haematococcus lacustris]
MLSRLNQGGVPRDSISRGPRDFATPVVIRCVRATCHNNKEGLVPNTVPVASTETDWREFRQVARLVASSRAGSSLSPYSPQDSVLEPGHQQASLPLNGLWAHSIPGPEKGCLLLAHPLMFNSRQEYFFQSVILLLEHNDKGSFGVILNRPSVYTLSQLQLTHPLPEFADCKLYVGGDVGDGGVHLLHSHADLEGSTEVVRGVNLGGIQAAQQAVAQGKAKAGDFRCAWGDREQGGKAAMRQHVPHARAYRTLLLLLLLLMMMMGVAGNDCQAVSLGTAALLRASCMLLLTGRRFYAKYSGWGAGQLARECRAGVWFTAAASPAVILSEPDANGECDTWHRVLSLMGGDYSELSMNVRASERSRKQSGRSEEPAS